MKTEESREIAACKAGMDAKTARKYWRLDRLPSELPAAVRGRTRPDPFMDVWDEVQKLFEDNPGLEAKTVFEFLQRQNPGRFQDGQVRTLQRRVKVWRATEGPAREVFFAQQHPPGRLGASDFTHMEELGVTIQGQSFPHLIYHFVLTYSNWEAATVCFSESFESLSEGLQNALWALGKVPHRHRTDRLSTAVNNMSDPAEFTDRYKGLMRFYGLESEKTQAGHGNENGDVEQRHHRFKRAVAQELMLRGSVDFASVDEYRRFLRAMLERLNAGRSQRLDEEMAVMRELPERRMESARRDRVKVDSGSLIYVDRNAYSVPSRLIGEQVEARLFMDHVEVWYGQKKVAEMPRLRGRLKHRVDYRHIIDWLVRKPGAFEHYRYRDELFPTSRFRMIFDLLEEQLGLHQGSKEYLKILELAAKGSEVRVEAALRVMLEAGAEQISAKGIETMLAAEHNPTVREVQVAAVDLRVFDQLFSTQEVLQ
ncbi:MAG TPA: IS21 family transposase [Alloacidobacterium sp.]|nr:IS21 family transposase [Alloacidobacterium sp.]